MTTTRDLDFDGLHLQVAAGGEPRSTEGGVRLPPGPVAVRHRLGATAFYRHGWHSWSPTRWVALGRPPHTTSWGGPHSDDPDLLDGTRHAGCWVGALDAGDGNVLLLGSLGLEARVQADEQTLYGDDATDGWLLAHGPEAEVFARYATLVGERLGTRTGSPGRVWCTWYSYGPDIDEERIVELLDQLDGLPFEVFQVDDGWQRDIGDWEAGDRFPGGMPALAERIRRAGLRPGLWLAPFVAHERSRLFGERPELFLVAEDGDPVVAGHNWGGRYHPLDLTREDAREWVWHTIRRACDWGFTYLKLDFLFAAALPGVRHDDPGREAAYRLGARTVRDAAGDDTFLLACGAPILPSIGVFDGLRIGPDVAPFWEHDGVPATLRDLAAPATRHAVSTSLHRLWLADVVAVDPDVAYFRTRHCLLTDRQQALLRDLAHLCGFLATSDPPSWLDPDERDRLVGFLTRRPEAARLGRHRFALDGREVDFRQAVLDDPETLPGKDDA